MNKKFTDVKTISYRISQIRERAIRGALKGMRKSANEIAQTAKDFAPVDEKRLVEAIRVRTKGGGRDLLGRFVRKEVQVYIEGRLRRSDGTTVARYAAIMHELLAPYGAGFYKLGKKSQAKASAGYDVGGKFLERALEEHRRGVLSKAAIEVKKEIRRKSRREIMDELGDEGDEL